MLEDHLIAISSYQRHSEGGRGEILFFETLKRFTRIPWKELVILYVKVLMNDKGRVEYIGVVVS